jgi:outer membrane lipoprotein-sorting protein
MTNMIPRKQLLLAVITAVSALPLCAAEMTKEQTFAKIDQVAKGFRGFSANIQTVQHMNAIHEDDAQSGTILVKRPHPKDLHIKVSIDAPEKKVAVATSKIVQVYYPSSAEIQEMEVGQRRSLLDMILTLGFGGTSKELQADYDVTLGGTETVAGESATSLQLIPRSKDMLDQWKRIDLWISDRTGYAVQQKFYEAGNDYMLITYTSVQPRADLPDSDFVLNVPKGTKKEPLNKKK